MKFDTKLFPMKVDKNYIYIHIDVIIIFTMYVRY